MILFNLKAKYVELFDIFGTVKKIFIYPYNQSYNY